MKTMRSLSSNKEDDFYDAREELSSASDWDSDYSEDFGSGVLDRLRYEVWAEKFGGVLERRRKFMKWMGLGTDMGMDSNSNSNSDSDSNSDSVLIARSTSEIESDVDRVRESSGTVLRTSGSKETFSSTRPSTSSSSSNEALELARNTVLVENCTCKGRVVRGLFVAEEFRRILHRDDGYFVNAKQRVKRGWLRKLRSGLCVVDPGGDFGLGSQEANRVQVYPYRKRTKELSSLHAGQEIRAHEGSISAMKFSNDGHYLASAGEDGVVRVWVVNESERVGGEFDAETDPSCQCFTVDHLSRLDPVDFDVEKLEMGNKLRRSNSVCVIYPRKVFSILDKPLHEFQGHSGEVLDLSWSSKGFLLSSSIDKTVRLWQVGCDSCLRVFFHNNYVTCVDFNPLDDNYFISGSIDGKVRIWEVRLCRVVDYIDVREIVTAVSYRPDGKGGIVGSMSGTCLFYNIVDDRLQLDAQICLPGKKKSPGSKITGFKFTSDDPNKVMITSADSLVRIVCGNNVLVKFKGLRNAASHTSASFTSDGKHIISATEDSNVYIWNYNSNERTFSHKKKSVWSSESFPSRNASIAIPWCGSKATRDSIPSPALIRERRRSGLGEIPEQEEFVSSPDCFSLSGFLESLPRGAATWPEEKLANSSPSPNPSPTSVSPSTTRSSKFKFLRTALQSMSGSPHMWGLVIVTAGWDGRIRTFLNYGLPLRV